MLHGTWDDINTDETIDTRLSVNELLCVVEDRKDLSLYEERKESTMGEIPESGRRRMPTGRELMARLRPQLDRFWNSPALSQQIKSGEARRGTRGPLTLREVAQDHLETLPTGLEAQPDGSDLHFIGKWTMRNGQMTDIEGQGNVLPSDDRLLVVITSTTVTSVAYAENDTHVALFEIVSQT